MQKNMKMEEKAIHWLEKAVEEIAGDIFRTQVTDSAEEREWYISANIHLFTFLLLLFLSPDPQSIILTAAHRLPWASN